MHRPQTLRSQFLLALIGIGMLPLVVTGMLLIIMNQQTLTEHSSRELRGLARGIGAELDLYVDARLNDSATITSLLGSESNLVEQQALLQTIFIHYRTFNHLSIYDTAGSRVGSSATDLAVLPFYPAGLLSATRRGVQYWSVQTLPDHKRALVIYTPIRAQNRSIVGALESVIELNELQRVIANIQVGGTGRALVLDGEGLALLHPDPQVIANPNAYAWPGLTGHPLPAGPGSFVYSWQEHSFVAAYYPITSLGWTVVVEQPEQEVLNSVRSAGMIGLLGLLTSTALTIIAALAVVNRLVLPLDRLAQAARAFGAGAPDTPLPSNLGQTRETAALIEAFVDMRTTIREALQGERTERALNTAILDGTPTGLVVLSAQQDVLSANPAFYRMLNLPTPTGPHRLSDLWAEPALQHELHLAVTGAPFQRQFLIEQNAPQRLFRCLLDEIQLPDQPEQLQLLVGIEDLTELTQLRLRYTALEVLQQIGQEILVLSSLPDTLETILQHAMRAGSFDLGVIWLYAADQQTLYPAAQSGVCAPDQLRLDPRLVAYIRAQPAITVFNDDHPMLRGCPHLCHEELQTALIVPIRRQEHTFGLLEIGSRTARRVASVECDLYEAISSQIGLAIQKERLDTALRASEDQAQLLALAASHTDNAVMIANSDTTIEWVNTSFTRISGYTLDEIRGRSPDTLLHGPQTDQATVSMIRSALMRGEGVRTEIINYAKDGHPYWVAVEIHTIFDQQGQISKFMSIESDISERKQLEHELRYQAALLAAQTEASVDGILVVGPDRRWMSHNQRFLELWFFDKTRPPTNSGEALPHMASYVVDPDQFLDRINDLYSRPADLAWDEIVLTEDRYYERYSSPIQDPQGEIYGRVWFYRDITARKRSEAALHHAKEEAERANRAKSEFLSRMSHELRTPLHAILGFAQVLDQEALTPSVRSGVSHILRAGQHLLSLINEVLDITRIEAGRMAFAAEPIQLYDALREVVQLVEPIAAPTRVTLTIDRSARHLSVRADRQRLKQILMNLLSNAVKYNRPGGRVLITSERNEHGLVQISVQDTGDGIAPELVARLFTPFDRLDAERRGVEGTGLGLALSKRLVELMGGQIGVVSDAGSGSRFWFSLPYADQSVLVQDLRPIPGSTSSTLQAVSATILCIEDHQPSVRLVEHVLSRNPGIKLISSLVGLPALGLAEQYQPDLILLDLNLPDINGLEVLRELQNHPATSHIPVVILSADANPAQLDAATTLGAHSYLTKPLNIRRFSEVIDGILRES